jgi:ElaB/YqjD/DUF883 family membrane-anchored ribosome-binding protein
MCGSRLNDPGAVGGGQTDRSPASFRLAAVRDRARFAFALIQTWSGARRQLAGIDAELQRLHDERQRELLALGDVTYRGDEKAAAQIRERIGAVDEQIEQEQEKQRRVVEEASRAIDHEHEFVAPTQIVDPAGTEEPEPKEGS